MVNGLWGCVRQDAHGWSGSIPGEWVGWCAWEVGLFVSTFKMSQGPNIILEWLSKLHLAQYVESFLDNGYDDLEVCKQIGEPDLDAIGVHIEYHRHRLLSAVQKLRDEDSRKAPGYYFTLEPLHASLCKHSSMLAGCRRSRSHPRGQHQPSCPGNHNLRVTDCNDFVTYPKLKLKVLIRDKLAKDGINLGEAPYTFKVSSFKRSFLERASVPSVGRSNTVGVDSVRLLRCDGDGECDEFPGWCPRLLIPHYCPTWSDRRLHIVLIVTIAGVKCEESAASGPWS